MRPDLGPRQVGKTTLLDLLPLKSRWFLDDLGLRNRAQTDPALFLEEVQLPALIDEAQYAPNLFPELKRRIDQVRRERLKKPSSNSKPRTLYYLTGSSRPMLDDQVKESLAGRAHLYTLHGLSLAEILRSRPELKVAEILFRGTLPQLYATPELSPRQFLNEYILSFVEKDVARGSGIEKIPQFQTVLRLLAARTGQFMNFAEIAAQAGVDQKSARHWTEILSRNLLTELVPVYSTNLSKRLVKMKKLFFHDSGLSARLMGFHDPITLWNSPQIGALFESLVFSEITKTRDNHLLDWELSTWRTKDQDEIDFVLRSQDRFVLLDAKLAIHGASPFELDPEAKRVFGAHAHRAVVTSGGEISRLNRETWAVPIQRLGAWLTDALRS